MPGYYLRRSEDGSIENSTCAAALPTRPADQKLCQGEESCRKGLPCAAGLLFEFPLARRQQQVYEQHRLRALHGGAPDRRRPRALGEGLQGAGMRRPTLPSGLPPRVSAAHHRRVASPDRLARRGVSCVRIAWRAGGSPGRALCAAQVPRSLSLRAPRGLLQVDGFRFDLMGHIMLRALNRARREIDGLTLEKDGIDGKMVPQRPCLHFPVLRI